MKQAIFLLVLLAVLASISYAQRPDPATRKKTFDEAIAQSKMKIPAETLLKIRAVRDDKNLSQDEKIKRLAPLRTEAYNKMNYDPKDYDLDIVNEKFIAKPKPSSR